MAGIYILASYKEACKIVERLSQDGSISPSEISAIVAYPDHTKVKKSQFLKITVIRFKHFRNVLTTSDILIVSGCYFNQIVNKLHTYGINNIYDARTILKNFNLSHRLKNIALPYHIGQNNVEYSDDKQLEFQRYISKPIDVGEIPSHKLFIVNSIPKSGTVWMIAMLELLLGVKAEQQVRLSHVMDIMVDVNKFNVHGAMVLVRDLRDVVVSWYHDMARCDLRNGFIEPRYTSITEFYFFHFIGFLKESSRYSFGDLEHWLNIVSYHSYPIVRYEDLINDAPYCLQKVMKFWKIRAPEYVISDVVSKLAFQSMQQTLSKEQGYISDLVKAGHLRQGKVGAWKEELPSMVSEDIEQRFSAYQKRLHYDV